jgi:hypothetical protein
MPMSYSVRVYRSRIPPIFRFGGEGNRWMYRVSVAMMNAARAAAPVRSSELKRAHRISRALRANQFAATFEIQNIADHAQWVHDGTPTIIFPENSTRLVLSPGNGFPRIYARSVRGQRGNPWLDNACTAVAVRYGAVRVS